MRNAGIEPFRVVACVALAVAVGGGPACDQATEPLPERLGATGQADTLPQPSPACLNKVACGDCGDINFKKDADGGTWKGGYAGGAYFGLHDSPFACDYGTYLNQDNATACLLPLVCDDGGPCAFPYPPGAYCGKGNPTIFRACPKDPPFTPPRGTGVVLTNDVLPLENSCCTTADCPTGQSCVDKTCVAPGQEAPGGLGATCNQNADCGPGLFCQITCRPPCAGWCQYILPWQDDAGAPPGDGGGGG
jgi:hypothetical protein